MSKRNKKKNVDDFEDVKETPKIAPKESKSKVKKGKNKKNHWSDDDDEDKVLIKLDGTDNEIQPVAKKNQKKCMLNT